MAEKDYEITAESLKNMVDRLNYLKSKGRAEMAAKIEEARSFGDLSENAEYDLARDEQAKMEHEIDDLEDKVSRAKVIDDKNIKTDTVGVGNTVVIVDESGQAKTYHIVGTHDSDPFNGKISNESPIGKELIGKKKGATISVTTKNGIRTYKIKEIKAK
ncbi:MAG: transcription elongation factor GreA [Clostridia bacterium]|nr:transcription elongation factor GreA [Clostridia bacterium]MBP5592660.1 transcription elongation factor GreA [Clostridia bacterium]MBP5648700.1 transcription elongation factor GreA [Clostridia bacterium]